MIMRRWHRWIGILTVAGITVASVTGLFLNHPDWINQPDHIQQAVPDSNGVFVLTESQLSYHTPTGGYTVRLRHPIRPGDRLIARQSGVAILHRDHALLVYEDGIWDRVMVPEAMGWITHVDAIGCRWTITTTTGVWLSEDNGVGWRLIRGPYDASMRDLVKRWHSGWIFGPLGQVTMSVTAVLTVGLSFSGVMLLRRRRKRQSV